MRKEKGVLDVVSGIVHRLVENSLDSGINMLLVVLNNVLGGIN